MTQFRVALMGVVAPGGPEQREDLDLRLDTVMSRLLENTDVIDPDIDVTFSSRSVRVWVTIEATDQLAALARAAEVLQETLNHPEEVVSLEGTVGTCGQSSEPWTGAARLLAGEL